MLLGIDDPARAQQTLSGIVQAEGGERLDLRYLLIGAMRRTRNQLGSLQ